MDSRAVYPFVSFHASLTQYYGLDVIRILPCWRLRDLCYPGAASTRGATSGEESVVELVRNAIPVEITEA